MHAHLRLLVLVLVSSATACATPAKPGETRRTARAVDPSIPRPKLRLVGVPDAPGKDKLTTLASYRVLRRVSMFYKLDLLRDNALSAAVAETMRIHEDRMRECYVARLDSQPELRGNVALRFQVSKATGQMERIARIGGSLNDRPLLDCMARELALLPINPPKSLNGRLLFSFNAVETLAKTP